jgi:hypothetical protein
MRRYARHALRTQRMPGRVPKVRMQRRAAARKSFIVHARYLPRRDAAAAMMLRAMQRRCRDAERLLLLAAPSSGATPMSFSRRRCRLRPDVACLSDFSNACRLLSPFDGHVSIFHYAQRADIPPIFLPPYRLPEVAALLFTPLPPPASSEFIF